MPWWNLRRRTNEVVARAAEVRRDADATSKLLARTLVQLHHTTQHVEEALKEIASDHPAE
jgi:hypothetical protein